MQFITHRRRHAPTIIIVALIDILIVLLIFLIVTTTFKNQQPSLRLTLPESRQAQAGVSESGTVLLVEVDKQAPYLRYNGMAVTLDQLRKEFASQAARQPPPGVAIRADALAPFEQIVRVMDAAREARLTNLSAHVRSP
ncbi:MAG: biopolymer transporter ExbD [Verrucomicrobiae bacterium]|nr:biopolymer transporter ExbD [Verrucomicrobiae bacterium]